MGMGYIYQSGEHKMTFVFSESSEKKLKDLDPRLVMVMRKALGYGILDFKIVETHRSVEEQQEAFRQGRSQIDGIHKKGKHNFYPSLAVDIAPCPVDYTRKPEFYYLAGLIMAAAKELGFHIRHGGDWNEDGKLIWQKNDTFDDLPHFELME